DADKEMFDVGTVTVDEVFTEKEVVAKDVNLIVDEEVSTTTTTIKVTTEEITLAQALEALKTSKPKVKGIVVRFYTIWFYFIVASVVICGLADGLIDGSLIGSAGKLPKEYMQAIFAGIASSACLRGPKWFRSEEFVVLLTFMLGFTNGYLTSVIMILAPKSVPPWEAEMAAIVMALFLGIGLVSGSTNYVWYFQLKTRKTPVSIPIPGCNQLHNLESKSLPQDLAAHAAWVKGQREVAVLMLLTKPAKINLDSSLLWHCRLGHISKKRIEKIADKKDISNYNDISPLEMVFSCFSAVKQVASYFVTFTDDFSRYGYVYLLKHKHEVFETFKVFQKEVENQLGKTIKSLRSDRGGEYMSQEFLDHLKEHGIIAHRTPPYTPQHNGVSERRNRTLLDMVRSMMSQTTLPKSFWDYALESAARILNMVPTKKVDKTPYEVWHGQAPKLSYLKVWGCEALVKRDTLTKPDKLEPRSIKCIFVGYPKETMGYSFYYPPENKVFVARNAEFLENSLIAQEASGSLEDLEIIQEEDTHPSLDTSLNHEEDDQEIDEPQSDIIPIRKSSRTRRGPNQMCLHVDAEEHELGDLGEPANYKAALLDPESDKWLNAMNVEMQSMRDNEVWELVDLPPNGKTVDTRAIRILIAIAAFYGYEIWQMDVKTAFLNGYLNEEVYMEQPEDFVNQKFLNRVCKLKRSIYGLKQASRQWNKRFDDEIKRFGFSQNRDEPCVNVKASGSYVTFLILYVDDILIMGNNIPMLQDVKSYLGRCFAMKDLGEAAYIFGIKIYRDRSKRLIGLCQSAYIKKILKRFYVSSSIISFHFHTNRYESMIRNHKKRDRRMREL
ncbi:retrotransposon protein, putative, ty1-copia subclass, partial [Tanacetum coccineum]